MVVIIESRCILKFSLLIALNLVLFVYKEIFLKPSLDFCIFAIVNQLFDIKVVNFIFFSLNFNELLDNVLLQKIVHIISGIFLSILLCLFLALISYVILAAFIELKIL